MPNLLIIRGAPGSGKDTYASKRLGYHKVTADEYFMKKGVYNFDPKKAIEAHKWCVDRVRDLLNEGKNVAVANTFLKNESVHKYIKEFKGKAEIEIVRLFGFHGNEHDIRLHKIEQDICTLAHEAVLPGEKIIKKKSKLVGHIITDPEVFMTNHVPKEDISKWISFELQVKLRDTYLTGIEYLVSCLYTLMPPLKLEWNCLKIVHSSNASDRMLYKKRKHLEIDDETCILHLTSNEYDMYPRKINLEKKYKQLADILRASIKQNPREYVIECNGEKVLKELYYRYTRRYTDVVLLRRAYISSLNFRALSEHEIEEIGKEMGLGDASVVYSYRVIGPDKYDPIVLGMTQ
jgi:predicted ABC-type ATPase